MYTHFNMYNRECICSLTMSLTESHRDGSRYHRQVESDLPGNDKEYIINNSKD